MISIGLVKIHYFDGYYENSDIKNIIGVVLNKSSNSITVGLVEKEIILNWNHIIKIETLSKKGLPSYFKI